MIDILIKVDDSVDDNNSPHGSRKDVHDKMLQTMLKTSLQPNKVIVSLRLINQNIL